MPTTLPPRAPQGRTATLGTLALALLLGYLIAVFVLPQVLH